MFMHACIYINDSVFSVFCFVILNRYWGIDTVPGSFTREPREYAPTIGNRQRGLSKFVHSVLRWRFCINI